MGMSFQFFLLRPASPAKKPNLNRSHGERSTWTSSGRSLARLERAMKSAGLCLIVMLFVTLACATGQVYDNNAAPWFRHAAILEDPVRTAETVGQAQQNLRELPELVVQSGHSGAIVA